MTFGAFEKLLDEALAYGPASEANRERVLAAYVEKCRECLEAQKIGWAACDQRDASDVWNQKANDEIDALREALYLIKTGPAVAGFAEPPVFEEWAKDLAERALARK